MYDVMWFANYGFFGFSQRTCLHDLVLPAKYCLQREKGTRSLKKWPERCFDVNIAHHHCTTHSTAQKCLKHHQRTQQLFPNEGCMKNLFLIWNDFHMVILSDYKCKGSCLWLCDGSVIRITWYLLQHTMVSSTAGSSPLVILMQQQTVSKWCRCRHNTQILPKA